MATFTLIYQGRVQGAYQFANEVITIGSDSACDIVIAAADVAPLHAAIQLATGGNILRQGDGNFPVTLNGKPVREHRLKDGDRIGIGGYMLFYVDEPSAEQNAQDDEINPDNAVVHDGDAFLQWQSGSHIGRITPLNNALTQLGKPGQDGAAVIAKRQGGYFFSAIDQDQAVKLNRKPLGDDTIQLNHGDTLEVGKQKLQFFRE